MQHVEPIEFVSVLGTGRVSPCPVVEPRDGFAVDTVLPNVCGHVLMHLKLTALETGLCGIKSTLRMSQHVPDGGFCYGVERNV